MACGSRCGPSSTGIESFRRTMAEPIAGDNTGLLLQGLNKDNVEPGPWSSAPGSIAPSRRFTANFYALSAREDGRARAFRTGSGGSTASRRRDSWWGRRPISRERPFSRVAKLPTQELLGGTSAGGCVLEDAPGGPLMGRAMVGVRAEAVASPALVSEAAVAMPAAGPAVGRRRVSVVGEVALEGEVAGVGYQPPAAAPSAATAHVG